MSEESIQEIMSKYTTLSEFTKNEKALYSFLMRKGMLSEYTSQLMRNKTYHTKEDILEKINECETRLQFCSTTEYKKYYTAMMKRHRELIPEYHKLK